MLVVVRRNNARSACSPGLKPILGKHADCRLACGRRLHARAGSLLKAKALPSVGACGIRPGKE